MSLSAQFQASNAAWGHAVIWTTSLMTALLFFATLLAHELLHALVARSRGLTTRAITLFALGGVAQIEKRAGRSENGVLKGRNRGTLSSSARHRPGFAGSGMDRRLALQSRAPDAATCHAGLARLHQSHAGGLPT